MERVAPGSRAALAATYAMLWSVGSTFGNYTSGVLQDTASGFAAAFAVGIGGYLVAGLWTAIVFPRLPRIGLDQAAAQPSPGSPAPEIAVRPEPG
jgi:hypothetical protein